MKILFLFPSCSPNTRGRRAGSVVMLQVQMSEPVPVLAFEALADDRVMGANLAPAGRCPECRGQSTPGIRAMAAYARLFP